MPEQTQPKQTQPKEVEPVLELLTSGWGLIEAPRVDADNYLYFSDVPNGGVRRIRSTGGPASGSASEPTSEPASGSTSEPASAPASEPEVIIPKRRGVGGMLFHADGGLVVSGRNIQHVPAASDTEAANTADSDTAVSEPKVLFDPGVPGFNDMHADQAGRIYVGSIRRDPFDESAAAHPGELYRINLDGSVDEIYGDVGLTNGIGFSPDGTRLYHSDTIPTASGPTASGPGCVWVSDVAGNTASAAASGTDTPADGTDTNTSTAPAVTNRRHFIVEPDAPDGLAVDVAGGVWVALANGGRVQRYTADGEPDIAIAIPDPMVTSVCFGGADMRDLYIVTGGATSAGGCIYKTRSEIAGVPTPLARV